MENSNFPTNALITDFHCHIIPGCDHGSDSVETSLKQIKMLEDAGIKRIVATPHFYPHKDSLTSFLQKRNKCFEKLSPELKNFSVDILSGAEVLICAGLDAMEGLEELCISGTNTILIEMPLTKKWNPSLNDTVFNIASKGFNVVLAHADRYPFDNINKLISHKNVFIQLNTSKVLSFKGRRILKKYLSTEKVVAIGSDLHLTDKKAAVSFTRMLKWANKYIENIFQATNKLLIDSKR